MLESAWVRIMIFCLFASAVFWMQGWQPNLIQDHIFYFLNADSILTYFGPAHPHHGYHQYWRGFSDNLSLSVLLAYLHSATNDHVMSCKVLLWVTTVLYLCSFYLFTSLYVPRPQYRVLLTLLSAFFISYGPTFWGFTDFQATLSRTLVVPIHLVLLYFYFKYFSSWARIWVFPAVTYSTFFHLSSFHLLGVLFTLELLRFAFNRSAGDGGLLHGCQIAVAASLAFASLFHLANVPTRSSVSQFLPFLCLHPLPPYAGPEALDLESRHKSAYLNPIYRKGQVNSDFSASTDGRRSVHLVDFPSARPKAWKDAWALEFSIARWRNFPPPASTLLIMAGSAGLISLMAALGFWMQCSAGRASEGMPFRLFAIAILLFSWGPQFFIFAVRHFVNLYPHNIEECRSLMYLTIPIVYFFYQLLQALATAHQGRRATGLQVLAILIFLLQPIAIVRQMPLAWRSALFRSSQQIGIIDRWESPRTMYAQQVLQIEPPSLRFYYACYDVIEWLKPRTKPSTLVVSDRPELVLSGAHVVGSPYNMIDIDPHSESASTELKLELEVNQCLMNSDYDKLRRIALSLSAKYYIVPGRPPGAVYYGEYYAVLSPSDQSKAQAF